MTTTPDVGRLARAIGDARRVDMLVLLMEGRALTAKELALGAGIEPATATGHLRRLLEDGLVTVATQGRHKYFRLASDEVAALVEAMMRVAPRTAKADTPRGAVEPIKQARYCYDHLAGELGTGLLALMMKKNWLEPTAPQAPSLSTSSAARSTALALTASGDRALRRLGVGLDAAYQRRRQFACSCLDWSERKDHLGGSLGAAMAEQFGQLGWTQRQKHSRVVHLSQAGLEGFAKLGLKLTASRAQQT